MIQQTCILRPSWPERPYCGGIDTTNKSILFQQSWHMAPIELCPVCLLNVSDEAKRRSDMVNTAGPAAKEANPVTVCGVCDKETCPGCNDNCGHCGQITVTGEYCSACGAGVYD